jgi:hypothetical protein
MTKTEIAKEYIDLLEEGNVDGIINLFAETGRVRSPIYGEKNADEFYKTLNDDTISSELKLKGIFEDSDTGKLALYFEYMWTVKSGKLVKFDVVDIIEFDSNDKILELTIIYDTVISRKLIDEIKN